MQRVSRAAVRVSGAVTGEIGRGLVVLLAVGRDDGPADVDALADKVAHLRVFDDPAGQMNLSVVDTGGGILAVMVFALICSRLPRSFPRTIS